MDVCRCGGGVYVGVKGVWRVCVCMCEVCLEGGVRTCQSSLLIVGEVQISTLIVKIEHKMCKSQVWRIHSNTDSHLCFSEI